ncbi:MAG TPA: hypothetical protein DCR55_13220 [Lentisphaeria bacterium]|nr:hypothetical protein [Lentisphaeria bacterium]
MYVIGLTRRKKQGASDHFIGTTSWACAKAQATGLVKNAERQRKFSRFSKGKSRWAKVGLNQTTKARKKAKQVRCGARIRSS